MSTDQTVASPASAGTTVLAMQTEASALAPIVRRNTLYLAGALALVWAGRQLMPTLGGVISVRLTGNHGLAGLALAVYMLMGAVSAWQAGGLMDRFGRRPALAASFVVAAGGMLAIGLAVLTGSFIGALLGLAVTGLGLGTGQLARLAAADMYPVSQRGKALSYVLMGGAVGAIVGPLATGGVALVAQARGGDPVAAPLLAAPLALLLGVVLIYRVHPDPRELALQVARLHAPERAGSHPVQVRPLRHTVTQFPAWTAIASITGLEAVMVMVMAIVPVAVADLGYSVTTISALVAIHFFGMFGLSIPIGWLADRVGRKPVLLAGCGVSVSGCFLLTQSHSLWIIGASFFCVGLGWSLGYLTATTVLADVTHPHERGSLIGLMDFSVAVSAAAASLASGFLYAAAGLMLVGLVGMTGAALPLVFSLRLRERAPGVYAS